METVNLPPTTNSNNQQPRTLIVINANHQDGIFGQVNQTSQLSSVQHTPITPGNYGARQDQPGRRTFICLPSPTSSPVSTTNQRVVQTYLITTPVTTNHQPHQNLASSPLPPPFPWTYSEEEIHDTANVQLSPVSPVRLASSPVHLASSPFNGPLGGGSELDHCNIASGSEFTVADFGATSESDSFYAKSESSRRGRPRLDDITSMIMEPNAGVSSIRCRYCSRTFPREKSLQAHIRTHTGERPYVCDFDSCGRAFAQSGQLRTHQRLHTGEKPFICAHDGNLIETSRKLQSSNFDLLFLGCENRFTHANRHCNEHPAAGVRRDKVSPSGITPASVLVSSRRQKKQVNNDDVENSRAVGKKRRAGAVRLRARKLNQELDAADDSCSKSSAQSATTENVESKLIIGEEEDYIPKKKRAALQLKANSSETATTSTVQVVSAVESEPVMVIDESPQDDLDLMMLTDDKLMGALALIELAGGSTSDICIKSEFENSSPQQCASSLLASLGRSANQDHVYY